MLRWIVLLAALLFPPARTADYAVHAVRYATLSDFPAAVLVAGADEDERLDIAMAFWAIEGDGRIVLFDSGFHRPDWMERFQLTDYMRPDSALRRLGIEPAEVTDIIISHAHWDHMGGIDLFPAATLWIQKGEYEYYTGAAWQDGGRNGGIDRRDILELVRRNLDGRVRLVGGDDLEILPGIRVYTGGRHTFASQYVRVATSPPVVLASDNAYLYRNLEELRPVATFTPADSAANLAAIRRMIALAGGADHVVPGHDPLQFERYASRGRVSRIR